jgi:uncharacterized protein with FMN-binding domain
VKRTILSITATVLGLVALLSFKTPDTQAGGAQALPSAALPAGGATSSGPAAPATSARSGPPTAPSPATATPSPTTSAPAPTAAAVARTVLGPAVQTQYGVVQVKITLSGSTITNAGFAQLTANDRRSQDINSQAAPILLQQTLSAQSAKIDGVSGASYTTQGYEQSLQSALDKAGIH